MADKYSTLTKDLLHELFDYRDGHLYWKVYKPRKKPGDVAGGLDKKGYWTIGISKNIYKAHRLIFMYHHGYVPKIVDHIDGDCINNRIENLREATHRQNCFNQKLRSNNKSGFKGVDWNEGMNAWRVQCMVDGKKKYFGCFNDLELAVLVAEEARNKYHGVFANHGEK